MSHTTRNVEESGAERNVDYDSQAQKVPSLCDVSSAVRTSNKEYLCPMVSKYFHTI